MFAGIAAAKVPVPQKAWAPVRMPAGALVIARVACPLYAEFEERQEGAPLDMSRAFAIVDDRSLGIVISTDPSVDRRRPGTRTFRTRMVVFVCLSKNLPAPLIGWVYEDDIEPLVRVK